MDADLLDHATAYRSLVDNSIDAVLLTAPDGRIVFANSATTAMFGYSEQELRTLGRAALVDSSDPRLEAALQTRQRTGRFRGELTAKHKDGTRLEVEVSSALFRDERGAEWTSMVIRDITDRKQQEAERERMAEERDAERRWLQAVFEHVPLGIVLFEPTGRLVFNRRSEEMLGMMLSPTGGSAQYRDRITFPDGAPVPPDQLISSRALSNGETVSGAEFVVERPDGARVPVIASAAPIRDTGNAIIGAIGVFQDVSERMRAGEAVRASERLLNGIFELLPVGVWIADRAGRIVRGNRAGIQIWGGARYVGMSEFGEYKGWWADTGQPIAPEEWALARALTKGETSIGEVIRIQCFDGTFKTIINSALPLHDDQGRLAGAIVVNEDITRLKDVEAALRQAIESRERVLEIVAHDLRHPLQVILALAQTLMLGARNGPGEREALHDIQDQIRRMDRLIQDLLDAAQFESGPILLERSPTRPEALLDRIFQSYQPVAAASSVELRREIPAPLAELPLDVAKTHRVFDNLMSNAMKFTPPGGRITLGAALEAGCIRFWVADTGRGVDAESLSQMFTPRWQAAPNSRGFGLGLAIAKSIVDAHGGRIWADSTVGKGTTVSFTIPLP